MILTVRPAPIECPRCGALLQFRVLYWENDDLAGHDYTCWPCSTRVTYPLDRWLDMEQTGNPTRSLLVRVAFARHLRRKGFDVPVPA